MFGGWFTPQVVPPNKPRAARQSLSAMFGPAQRFNKDLPTPVKSAIDAMAEEQRAEQVASAMKAERDNTMDGLDQGYEPEEEEMEAEEKEEEADEDEKVDVEDSMRRQHDQVRTSRALSEESCVRASI